MIKQINKLSSSISGFWKLVGEMRRLQEQNLEIERARFIAELLAIDPKYSELGRLNRYEFKVFSQSGQDGIISEIFKRIGIEYRFCVEIGVGVGHGFQNNTAFLLANGWSGRWFDADADAVKRIKSNLEFIIREGRLAVNDCAVTVENAASLFSELGVPRTFDLLSIDIDGNDMWVLNALADYKPRVIVIEYNSFLPASSDWAMEYDPLWVWEDRSMQFGASLKALEKTGRNLGYNLVGCDLTGSDAFFVQDEICGDLFCRPFTSENHYEPMRYYLISHYGYTRKFSEKFSGGKNYERSNART